MNPASKSLIVTCQREAAPLPGPEESEYLFLLRELSRASTFIFPEYFAFHDELHSPRQRIDASVAALDWLKSLSLRPEARNTLLVGGSLLIRPEGSAGFQNTIPVFFNGELLGTYSKRRLYKIENELLVAGDSPLMLSHPITGEKWGFLVCADVYLPEAFEEYRGASHIAIPTASPWLELDTPQAQNERDKNIYLAGAQKSGATVHKSCITGMLSSEANHSVSHVRVQGRSLIASPDEIILRAPHINWRGTLQWDPLRRHATISPFQEL